MYQFFWIFTLLFSFLRFLHFNIFTLHTSVLLVRGEMCPDLREKWITFVSQLNFELSQNTRLCMEHFEEKYIKYEAVRNHLKWNMMPIPTIHTNDEHDLPISPSSLSVPKTPRNGPRKGLFQEDQMYDFIVRDQIKDFT